MPISRRVLPVAIASMLVSGALSTSARAQSAPTIVASGIAQVKPDPADRHSDASIRKAVDTANAKALPKAIAAAREHAGDLAAAAGVRLGALQSIADASGLGFGYFYSLQTGTFGNGHFCGQVRRTKTVVGANGLRRRVAAKGTHKVCRIPPYVVASVSLTFATA